MSDQPPWEMYYCTRCKRETTQDQELCEKCRAEDEELKRGLDVIRETPSGPVAEGHREPAPYERSGAPPIGDRILHIGAYLGICTFAISCLWAAINSDWSWLIGGAITGLAWFGGARIVVYVMGPRADLP